MIRTTKVEKGTKPYDFNLDSAYQCTWFAYYRPQEEGLTPPCYWDRPTRTGKYTNAKHWLENYREPWEVKGLDYNPQPMDVVVCTGTYGHAFVIEANNEDGTCLCSDYNRKASKTYDSFTWKIGETLKGCGKVIGYLHYPREVKDYKALYEEAKAKLDKIKEII